MKTLLLLIGIITLTTSSTLPYYGVTVGISEHSHPVQSLYHAQDIYGQYVYGYATPTSTKSESKTADGVTRGGYSYIDSNGILQSVEYTADPIHGFRVAATNLPKDLPDVALAKAQHLAQYAATKAVHEKAHALHIAQFSNPIIVPFNAVQPTPVKDLPEVIRAREEHLAAVEAIRLRDASIAAEHAAIATNPTHISPVPISGHVVPIKASGILSVLNPQFAHNDVTSQYHAQNIYGQYSYGYAGPYSAKTETKTADGVTRGGYSYIDSNGILQTVHYTSDPINGFRVAASNIPIDNNQHISHTIHY